jgi:hypothetical protein
MSTIVTRAGKGSALTHNEVDANFTNLNTDKIQSGNTVTSLTVTSISGTTATYTNAIISSATISGGTITGITDLAVADGGTGISSGTSGGVPYFSGSTTIASSAALAANALVIGGGVGLAPATTTTGTGVITALGVNTGSAGAFVVNGGALGTPSSGTVTNLTGTASININGTVGATTANTGAFTTLSATGVTTVQAGTASAPAITKSGDTNTGIFFPAADTIAFTEGGVEAVRFDSSGNVGIGTNSPSYKLDVAGFAKGGIINRKGTYTAGTTTPSVSGISYMSITNSSPTTITNFTNGEEGQVIYLHFNDSNTTITRNNAYLAGGANFVSTAADTLTLVKEGLYWYEISRSANA